VEQADIDRLGPQPDFAESIRLIASRASAKELDLVIRDWTHLDFTGPPLVTTPAFALTTVNALAPYFRIRQVATVRHPIDEWQSLRRRTLIRGLINLDGFLKGYRRFAEVCQPMGFVRFEDFCADPDAVLGRLCAALEISFDPGWKSRWAGYDRMTGDETADRASGDLKLPRRRSGIGRSEASAPPALRAGAARCLPEAPGLPSGVGASRLWPSPLARGTPAPDDDNILFIAAAARSLHDGGPLRPSWVQPWRRLSGRSRDGRLPAGAGLERRDDRLERPRRRSGAAGHRLP
jgi:hypothetical protein